MRPFVFLDRDGTLHADRGYTHRIEDYAPYIGVAPALRRLARAGYALAIVTNQSGIARGIFSEEAFEAFQRHLLADLARQGVSIEASLHCPHLPQTGCACRKPAPGLLHRAVREHGADLSRSWVIGDQSSDLALAEQAGCEGSVLVLTGQGKSQTAKLADDVPRAADLAAAVEIVLGTGSLARGAPG